MRLAVLIGGNCHPTSSRMTLRARWRVLGRNPVYRLVLFLVGAILMIVSPLAGLLPGPGGILVFAVGLGLVLRNSIWAKRNYVRFKRVQPRVGNITDWGLRRQSAKRRSARDKAQKGRMNH